MGFVGFLRFSLKCIDVFAWPLFALGYPLCASIRAIETNSNHHMRKLVAYWILFSLISLFELAFVKLIQWVPLWPYMKIIAICWLVIPRFTGAYYAYKRLVQPCLSMDPRVVINWLIKPKESSLQKETFLAVAERYVKENGSEALENLIASKSNGSKSNLDVEETKAGANTEENEVSTKIESNCKEPGLAQKDIGVEDLKVNNAAAANMMTCAETTLAQTDEKLVAAVELKEMTVPVAGGDNTPLNETASNKVQKQWTCAVCQLTTLSEKNLNAHFQGKKHIAKCEELKAKNEEIKAATNTEKNEVPTKFECADTKLAQTDEKTVADEKVKEMIVPAEVEEMTVPAAGGGTTILNETASNKTQEWTCAVCQLTTQSVTTLNSHLQGKKHRAKCEELKASKQAAKNKASLSSTAFKSDQSNQDTKKCASGNGLNQNKTKKQEEKVQVNVNTEQCKEKNAKNAHDGMKQSKYRCGICKVTCHAEIVMASHLNGKKHLSRIKQMSDKDNSGMNRPKYWCGICSVDCLSEIDMASHLNGRKHLSRIQEMMDLPGSV